MTISKQTLIAPSTEKVSFLTKLKTWFRGERIALVNEDTCLGCGKWSHETPPNTWRWEEPDADHRYGHHVEIKTCGDCGYESRWVDTGFMGVMGCIDKQTPKSASFWHHLPKDRR